MNVTRTQARIINLLKETGGVEPEVVSERLQINPSGLEHEIATLRHMEKVKSQLRGGKGFFAYGKLCFNRNLFDKYYALEVLIP